MQSLMVKVKVNVNVTAKSALLVFSFLFLLNAIESSSPHPDKIVELPGQPQVGFQHFSGYVTVDDHKDTSFFYYFVEAQSHPTSKPLVLWLNGGSFLFFFKVHVYVDKFSHSPPFDWVIRTKL